VSESSQSVSSVGPTRLMSRQDSEAVDSTTKILNTSLTYFPGDVVVTQSMIEVRKVTATLRKLNPTERTIQISAVTRK
jgi:hypothetical protein